MVRLAKLFAVAVFTVGLIASPIYADVQWNTQSFAEIVERAQKEDKHVFIDFYAVWCGPCKRLEKVTYKDPKVIDYLNSIIPVKYDAEKGDGKILAEKFRVKAYPTLVLLTPDGKEIDRHLGFLDPDKFLLKMQDYQKGIGTIQYYKAELEKNSDDLELLHTLGMKCADALLAEEAKEYLGKIIKMDPANEQGYTDQALFALGETFYSTDAYEEAKSYFDQLLEKFPESKSFDYALVMLARTHHKMGDEKQCLDTYMQYVNRHPDDPKAMNSFAWFCASRKIGLDIAPPIAKKAVKLSNESPGILDTLAEIYYAMGDYEKAVEIEEKAAAKEPEDVYYKDQIIKFLKAALEASKEEGKHAER
ncbi:MAG: tetratricopeptide repeat protein [Candidatus Latescibacteria bacterium]|nr:tetratricopeptide repeat protein [Candidatus Latescibacterota bacterium]NIM22625.1 tetratricopeptide repeat protein [Candidatus Latescibacterota bacterium]NIO01429.1 tetratricopeptide repeat protein [Candidatus Latescibacterota bacterium]NIO27939.1 tetratricopeptide repeat protein [Candidatus Latescibacterota bacterium]NIO55490.1 tetratricopeptide repeat protein [Candidatus Latescibacterota bacterium]